MRLTLTNQLSPLLDAGYVEEAVRGHFAPLLDAAFDEFLGRKYPRGVSFRIDGQELAGSTLGRRARADLDQARPAPDSVGGRIPRTSHLSGGRAAGRCHQHLRESHQARLGLARHQPADLAHQWIDEVPDLAACLTLSKNDFIRTGTRGATYLAYRKAIQEVVSQQLAAWGNASGAEARPRVERLERDLERVLEDLADDFPLLQSLVDRRAGGQKRLPLPGRGRERTSTALREHARR